MNFITASHVRLNLRQQQSDLNKRREKHLIPETFQTTHRVSNTLHVFL